MSKPLDVIISHMPKRIAPLVSRSRNIYEKDIREITLRSGRPVVFYCSDKRYYLSNTGYLTTASDKDDLIISEHNEVSESVMSLCEYSVYSKQDEINRGFITAAMGVRVGLCGEAVIRDGCISNMKNISTLSFRVPREVKGCSDKLLELIEPLYGVLICGAPGSGKTTLIRDIARSISYRYRVSIIDERNEISSSCSGICGYDMASCDVFVNIPKREGVINCIRSLSPDIIVCDELGDEDDIFAISAASRCGAAFIATIHAATIYDLKNRTLTQKLLSTGAFRYIVFLDNRFRAGRISRIYEWGE